MDIKEKVEELNEEEVDIYTPDCGHTRLECVTDCFWVSPFLTTQE